MREQSLPLTVRRGRVDPELLEVRRHRDEPFADCIVQDDLILASCTLPFLSCLGEGAQLVVPVCLESIGDEAITRIDHHETALRQVRFDLSSLDRATPQL